MLGRSKPKAKLRRILWRSLAAIGLTIATLCQAVAQSNYPERPIRIVVAFAPGGITDVIARLLSQRLSEASDQSVYVDNKPGAAGELGAKLVSTAAPDGYTLLVTTTAVAIASAAQPIADVNPQTQLTPLALPASSPTLFAVKTPATVQNLMEFIQEHKSNQLNYASAGTGTTEHLTAAYVFKEVPGLQSVHIPYRSGGEVVNAVLGAQVDVGALPAASALPMIQQSKLQPLAVASHNRVAMFPNVPTLAEEGLIDLDNASWVGVFGPPGLPKPVVEVLSAKLRAALQIPALRKRLRELGFDMPDIGQPQLANYMGKEVAKWGQILKATGITLDQ